MPKLATPFCACLVSSFALLAVLLSVLFTTPAFGQAPSPVKTIDVYVQPYYAAATTEGASPAVAVSKAHDTLLASTKQTDVVQALDSIANGNALITPMTLMVLAIRLYDVGLRDESVFWFYVAKDRYLTLAGVANMNSPMLADVGEAVKNFATLAGPVINGYAFCDTAKQAAARSKALQWVIDNPYKVILLPKIPAPPGDRNERLAKTIEGLKRDVVREKEFLSKPENIENMKQGRAKSGALQRFCWK
jgi:hypothetical protein